MLGYSATVAVLHLFLLFLGPAHAAPAINAKRAVHSALRVARAGENLAESTTIETTNTLQTSVGTMIEKCTIQLDPITGDNGEPLVRETRTCTVSMGDGNNPPPPQNSDPQVTSNAGATATSSADGAETTSTDGASASASDASATSADGSSPSTTDGNASATSVAASAAAPSSSGGAINDDGVTLVPGSQLPSGATSANSASATATSSAASASATGNSNGAISPGGFTSIAASEVATTSGSPTATVSGSAASVADAAATSAADTAETSAAKFELPGTHLSVLPIGLGVFAGISVIALIVVGLVTYERTKYRKAFRQRKLAESWAAMGYGGMAQAA